MSRDATAALIRTYLEAFNAKDFDGMLACLGEDVIHDVNQGGREIGREKFRWFNARMTRHYDENLADIEIMVNESGSRSAAEFTVHGSYLATDEGLPEANGQRYSLPAGIFFEIDDGLISRVTTTYNLNDWIAQVKAG
ncbi:steroid delta-isomerase-related protein [Hoeflea phototrophica DFL-43]|uniref:Steroid delta-isomerase-related protein n=1 Tax=Hoeflea phototrophica (strain DSM 17068 / NCIMB 14078 / DFL-43) TaxID=411684 RepID=A9DE74_HOEPD|nr:ketosteroid isomerase-related protein [Hoeflea phototrophica]EDQ31978.1 steroid delta-isomerase-related protein [Hoeflea phototrophica DFL-43]